MKNENIFEEILSKTRVPLLITYSPYKDMIKYGQSSRMSELTVEINEVIKEEKAHILEVNTLHREKSRITASVLYLSNEINTNNIKGLENELEENKNRMEDIREEIIKREDKIQSIILLKEDLNLELLKATITYAYEFMKKDRQELDKLLAEIEKLRQKLKQDREKRDKLEKRINSIYGFLHSIVGAKETERFDEEFLKE